MEATKTVEELCREQQLTHKTLAERSGLEVPAETPVVDLVGGTLRAIDLGRVLQRHVVPQAQ